MDLLSRKKVRRDYVSGANIKAVSPRDVDRVCALAYTVICCANDLCDNAVRDAVNAIKATPHYKFMVKKGCNETLREYDAYQRCLKASLGERMELWCAVADEYVDRLQPHVDKLRWAILQRMLDLGVESERARLDALVMTADVLLRVVSDNFRGYFVAVRNRVGVDLSGAFARADLRSVWKRFRPVAEYFLSNGVGGNVDFADDARCALALKCVTTQMLSYDLMEAACDDALKVMGMEE